MTLNKICSFAIAALLLCCGKTQAQTAQQWRDSLAVLGRQIEASPHSVELRLRKAAVNLELGQWDYAAADLWLTFAHILLGATVAAIIIMLKFAFHQASSSLSGGRRSGGGGMRVGRFSRASMISYQASYFSLSEPYT